MYTGTPICYFSKNWGAPGQCIEMQRGDIRTPAFMQKGAPLRLLCSFLRRRLLESDESAPDKPSNAHKWASQAD